LSRLSSFPKKCGHGGLLAAFQMRSRNASETSSNTVGGNWLAERHVLLLYAKPCRFTSGCVLDSKSQNPRSRPSPVVNKFVAAHHDPLQFFPLPCSARDDLVAAAVRGDDQWFMSLGKGGIELDPADAPVTLMHEAARGGSPQIIRFLVSKGTIVEEPVKYSDSSLAYLNGATPFVIAACHGHAAVAEVLANAKA
jgi:hypothetical protein